VYKGFHVLAKALGALAARAEALPRWRWVLVGDGPYRATIEAAVRDAGVGSRMIATGRLSDADLASWYDAADLFVHPTLYEGSSLVTLEAMARDKAVVATRAGGLPDKVVPGVTGWLVEPGQPAQLEEALASALSAPEARLAFGQAGRQLVEREFSWPAVAARLIEIYGALELAAGRGIATGPATATGEDLDA
jgi:glycosyltransferase involved in cell wall biosynthesis